MSMVEDEKVICPLCGKISLYIKHVSVNFMLEPELLEPGAMEHLNDFQCARCGLRISAEKMERYVPYQRQERFRLYMARRLPKEERLRFLLKLRE